MSQPAKRSFVEVREGRPCVRWTNYWLGLGAVMALTALLNGLLLAAGLWRGADTVVFGVLFGVLIFNVLVIYEFSQIAKSIPADSAPAGQPPPGHPTAPQPAPSPRGQCPRCGATLAPDAPEGLCPNCLMALNLATATDEPGEPAGPHGTHVVKPPPETPLPPADIAAHFPHLEILECLGRGGMGVVYKARQPKLNRFVALKILAPEKKSDPKFAERFQREAQALARLNHPNIVAVHDFGEADGLFYLMMEYVDGASLRQLFHQQRLAPETALAIVPKICEALQFAHERGIVHRDIKPENVLLDQDGRVKIADFGIAKLVGQDQPPQSLTEDKQVIGTPHYMAPEQVEQPQLVDHRADIYSLGVVFYEMLTGELPLGKFAPPSRKVAVDVRLDEVVLHALEKEPARRYQHASQVKTDVESIAHTPPPAGGASRSDAAAPSERQREALLWYAIIVSLIGLPVGLALNLPYVWALSIAGIVLGGIKLANPRSLPPFLAAWMRPAAATPQPAQTWAARKAAVFLVVACAFAASGLIAFERASARKNFWTVAALNLVAAGGFAVAAYKHWRFAQPREHSAAVGTPRRPPADRLPPQFSRVAIAGACWAPFAFACFLSLFMVHTVVVEPGQSAPGPTWWQLVLRGTVLPLGLAAPFGTTICGAVALSQIRRSQGRLYGLGLALVDALLFPLLLLDAGIVWLVFMTMGLFGEMFRPVGLNLGTEPALEHVLLPALLVCLVVDAWLAHWAWRAAKCLPGASRSEAAEAADRAWNRVAVPVSALLLLVATILAVLLPYQAVQRARELVQQRQQQVQRSLNDAEQRLMVDRGGNGNSAPLGIGTAELAPDEVPPVVIRTVPISGAADVNPELAELLVTFSKPMQDGTWAWTATDKQLFPETTGQPHFLADGRTCVLPVRLLPGRTYALWLNNEKQTGFTDTAQRPALPYLLIFQTQP